MVSYMEQRQEQLQGRAVLILIVVEDGLVRMADVLDNVTNKS